MGVNKEDIGAGDQGMMFGYATNETEDFMPYTAYLANKQSLDTKMQNMIDNLRNKAGLN